MWPVVGAGGVLATCLVAALLTWGARGYALHRKLLDQPGERRSHDVATPRGGGIAIVVSQLLAYLVVGFVAPASALPLAIFSAGLLLVAGIGWWDDHRPLPASTRLCVHVLAGFLLGVLVWWQGDGSAFKAIFSALLAVVLINVLNFMDGINGLATTQAILAAIAFALLLPLPQAGIALLLTAGCLGFLPFNFPKARIFMGDVGSGALGYLLAALLAAGFGSRPVPVWPLLLLPAMAMLVDTGLTLLWRLRRGDRWWQAHVQHAFQRWSRWHGHVRVTAAFAGWTFVAAAIMLAALQWPPGVAPGVALAALLASAGAWRWLHRRYHKDKTEGFGT